MTSRDDAGDGRSRLVLLVALGLGLAGALWWTCSKGQGGSTPGTTVNESERTGPTEAPIAAPGGAPLAADAWKLKRATISGLVCDAKGQAIAGAQVCALTNSPLLDASDLLKPPCAATGRDGHYRIEGLWPVRYMVSGSAPGHVPAFHVRGEGVTKPDAIELKPGAEARDVDITLHGGAVEIRGAVKDLSGGAVEGASVTSGGLFYGTGMAVTTSGPEGEFALWVRPGTPQVWARAEGYAGGSDSGAAPGHEFELFLTPEAVLIGKVVRAGDGTPVEGARVTAQRGDTFFGGGTGAAITDAKGNFRLAQLTPGAYKASVEADDVYGMAAEQVVLGLGETSVPIVIEAHPAALVEGKVVIAGGVACPDGSVSLDAASKRHGGAELEADGLARMRGLLPGTYAVTVRCDGFVSAEKYEPIVVADKAITGLRWDVTPGQAIRGTVMTPSGEPVAGINVMARPKADPARPNPRSNPTSVATDAQGRFEITGVLPGSYMLQVYAMSGGRATPDKPVEVTVLEAQDLADIRIEMLAAGEVRGEVRDGHGKPVARAKVSLQAPGRRGPSAMTGDDGSFHVREAAVGEYRATASREGVQLRAPGTGDDDVQGEKVTVEANVVATVKLVVETGGGQIVGVVRDAGGGVVSDAFVEVDRESESAVGPGGPGPRWFSFNQRPRLTDAEGRFTIEALFPGTYKVRALRRGGGEATIEHVALGADVTLTIAETGRLAGTVALKGGGAPQDFTALLEDPSTGYHRKDQFFRTAGSWSFAELPPGTYKLQITAPEGTESTELSLGSGEEKAGVRLELTAKVKLRGTVLDLEGARPWWGSRCGSGRTGSSPSTTARCHRPTTPAASRSMARQWAMRCSGSPRRAARRLSTPM